MPRLHAAHPLWQYVRTYYCIRVLPLQAQTRDLPRTVSPPSKQQPRYRVVADKLIAGILAGRFPKGSILPGETEVARQFGISRHTARDAMRVLEQAGMITRRRRVGSMVISDELPMRYNQRIQSINDLLQYSNASRLKVFESLEAVLVDGTAALLRLKPGAICMLLKCIRYQRHDNRPFAYSEIYFPTAGAAQRTRMLDPDFATLALLRKVDTPRLGSIEQTLSAESASRKLALLLKLKTGAATLRSNRLYVDTAGKPVAAATTWHAGDLFSYTTTLTKS